MKPVLSETLINAFNDKDSLFSVRPNKDKTGYNITTIYDGKEVIAASFCEANGQSTNVVFDPKSQYPKDLIAVDIASMPDGEARDTILASLSEDLINKNLANKLRAGNTGYHDTRKKEIQEYNIAKTMIINSKIMKNM